VQQAQRLVMEEAFDPDKLGEDGMAFVISVSGFKNQDTLKKAIFDSTAMAAVQIERILNPN
jgi:hypothetical protein